MVTKKASHRITTFFIPAFFCGAVLLQAPQAQTVTSGKIFFDTATTVDSAGAESIPAMSSGGLSLMVDTEKSQNIKASVQLTVNTANTVSLDRAYFKSRFPGPVNNTSIRFTGGKAPLSWGKGFLFNAGDPVFGELPAFSSLSASEYRTATEWMAVTQLSFGSFSFLEAVYLPPATQSLTRAGGRLFLTADRELLQSIEAGYLFEEGPIQHYYLAIDGSLFFDWYGAAGYNDQTPVLSFGLFRMFDFIPEIPVAVRMEGIVYPETNRELWYPSLQVSLTDEFSFSVQSLFATGSEPEPPAAGIVPAQNSALAYLSPDGAIGALTLSFMPIKNITLSATALRQFEKGDIWKNGTTVQFGCTAVF